MSNHIIITGASRGIGKAVALHYAKKGWLVSICAHSSQKQLTKTSQDLETAGGQCFSMLCDIGNDIEADAFIQNAVNTFGIPDILINNAGISYIGLTQDMSTEDWNTLLQTNLSSVFYTCRAIIPHFLSKKAGSIINISSVWGNVGAAMEVAYSASKGGVNAFTKALAKELAPSHIKVNALACGFIDTDMNQFLNAEERETLINEIPAGRAGTPEEVAKLVDQIASAPDYLTGQVITLDGGWQV